MTLCYLHSSSEVEADKTTSTNQSITASADSSFNVVPPSSPSPTPGQVNLTSTLYSCSLSRFCRLMAMTIRDQVTSAAYGALRYLLPDIAVVFHLFVSVLSSWANWNMAGQVAFKPLIMRRFDKFIMFVASSRITNALIQQRLPHFSKPIRCNSDTLCCSYYVHGCSSRDRWQCQACRRRVWPTTRTLSWPSAGCSQAALFRRSSCVIVA